MALSLTFQVAFGSHPTDSSFTWTTVPGTKALSYSRGAPNEYGQPETGESTVVLGDASSDLDPNNTSSPYYPNVRRMRPMRAYITIGVTNYPLFQHFIERLPRAVSVGRVWTERNITGVDAFAWFALAGLKGQSYASEPSGTRFGNVLDSVDWPSSRRDIDGGNSTLDAITFDANADTKALTHLLDVITSENGFGFMDADGDARFIERHASLLGSSVVATLADGRSIAEGGYSSAIPYVDLQPESTEIVNDYSGQRASGTAQTVSDSSSISAYGPRSAAIDSLVSTDVELLAALQFRLSQTKDPYERVDAIVVRPGSNLTRWATLLGLEVGDRITVVEWPPGFSAPVAQDFLIRHLAVSLPVPLEAAEFTFQLTPASAGAVLILDDATSGRLDTGILAY
jgi:hypothetical protein